MPRPLAAAALFLVFAAPYGVACGGLSLELTDGSRVTVGEVAAVNDSAVTVAAVGEKARVERRIPWRRISEANLDGQTYSTAEVRLAFGLAPSATVYASHVEPEFQPYMSDPRAYGGSPCPCSPGVIPIFARPAPGRVIGVRPDPLSAYADLSPAVYPVGIPTTEAPFALGLLRERRRAETIAPFAPPFAGGFYPPLPLPLGDATPGVLSQIEARVTPLRRGGGADVNALGVELVGLDDAGRTMPVEGTAQIFLYVGEQRLVNAFDGHYVADPKGLVRFAEWTRLVQPDASLILRLPERLPDHDHTVSAVGTLRVRLSVSGVGIFETIAEPIPLRPASPFRDAAAAETGSRFLPDEKTSGSRDQAWPRKPDLSSVE